MARWQRQFGFGGPAEGLPEDGQGLPFEVSPTRRLLAQGEQNTKGEEKALARRSLLAEAANRYTWKLKIR
jgi:hypothetical protein